MGQWAMGQEPLTSAGGPILLQIRKYAGTTGIAMLAKGHTQMGNPEKNILVHNS